MGRIAGSLPEMAHGSAAGRLMRRGYRQGNTRSTLKRRVRQGDPMAAYDRLPPALRAWLAQAALPWSAPSALRLWQRFLHATGGDIDAAQKQLTRHERQVLERDRFHMVKLQSQPTGAGRA